jgi:mannose-6-phosphate isomerase-like protein (cupin superfamily)
MDGDEMDSTFGRRGSSRESNWLKPVRRIVTGHNQLDRAVIVSDGVPPRVQTLSRNGPTYHEIWSTRESPAQIDRTNREPHEDQLTQSPPIHGTRMRVLDILPERYDAAPTETGTRKELTHQSTSIDYVIVLRGEITLILDEEETLVRAGDIVIQQGTNHTWANRSGRLCRIALVLIDATLENAVK